MPFPSAAGSPMRTTMSCLISYLSSRIWLGLGSVMSAWYSTLHYSLVRGILATGVGNRADFVIIVIIIQGLLTAVICTILHHRGIGLHPSNLLFVSVVCEFVRNRVELVYQPRVGSPTTFLSPRNSSMPLPSFYYSIPVTASSALKAGLAFSCRCLL